MNYAELAREQDRLTTAILESALTDADCIKALTKSYCAVKDMSDCIDTISHRREVSLFSHALKEYQFSLFAVNQGFYRHAFSALRLSFELWLSAIEFSTNELALRRWEKDSHDINWQRLINNENGIFSVNFIRAFSNNVEDRGPHYRTLAERVYRECSQHVHGNASTHENLPAEFSFSKSAVLDWCEKASTIHMINLFSFFVRYLSEMPDEKKIMIESPFISALGHIKEVRLTFGADA